MSFLKRLFGGSAGGSGTGEPQQVGDAVEHKGFTIRATPYSEGGQYQTCGVVSREVDGAVREHRFVRADRFPSIDDAAAQALRKGRQLVDEQGEALFG
ncbi:HlyU family transcriptional regulator [Aquibium sp. A9E412]|uniref:HlyU family transcriptional regulator n=1 Tax=Aquibium sp. A9E412 TaxID=2976767 RepID=UPI0025B14450|nr:HlyU family transcriptional regulator [Aquibium sp. A9E412]MDN2565505.1 HlyU family transcriptional regulator [Aquibium sp. A9E412]